MMSIVSAVGIVRSTCVQKPSHCEKATSQGVGRDTAMYLPVPLYQASASSHESPLNGFQCSVKGVLFSAKGRREKFR